MRLLGAADSPVVPDETGVVVWSPVVLWRCPMGIGMQIVYLGFAGSAPIEAEAGAQFVRLERFWKTISGCHLAIEALHDSPGHLTYDARLDLITRANELIPVKHCLNEDANVALRAAFDAAEQQLESASHVGA
jgi:hypothetical protein